MNIQSCTPEECLQGYFLANENNAIRKMCFMLIRFRSCLISKNNIQQNIVTNHSQNASNIKWHVLNTVVCWASLV